MDPTKLILACVAAAVALVASTAERKIPLAVKYPDFVYNGTPKPTQQANLEPSPGSPPEFLVSPGTTLLSRGKPVTGSDSNPIIGELSFITDGDKTGIDGTVLELGPGRQWVQIDLGASARIAAIVMWHFHSEARVYHDVIVQISDDPTFSRNVTNLFNNDADNSSKLGRGNDRGYVETRLGRLIDASRTSGRYVRLYSNGNTSDELNHYCEVEVFGERPVLPPGARIGAGARPSSSRAADSNSQSR